MHSQLSGVTSSGIFGEGIAEDIPLPEDSIPAPAPPLFVPPDSSDPWSEHSVAEAVRFFPCNPPR